MVGRDGQLPYTRIALNVNGIRTDGPPITTQAHGRGSHVHRDMAPVIRCRTFGGMDRLVIKTHRQNHNHHNHHNHHKGLNQVDFRVELFLCP